MAKSEKREAPSFRAGRFTMKQRIMQGEFNTPDDTCYNKKYLHRGSFDYSLFVLDPNNNDTTNEQFRECTHSAITMLDERLKELEDKK